MKTLKNPFSGLGTLWELVGFLIVPTVLLFLVSIFLSQLGVLTERQNFNVIIGIALGVALGFIADITKRNFDEFQNRRRLRKVWSNLLKADAIHNYRNMWLYESLMNDSTAPAEMKKFLPPRLEFRFWNRLIQSDDFAVVASEKPFTDVIIQIMNFEKINEQFDLNDKGKSGAAILALGMYKEALKRQEHKKLLLNFMTAQDIDGLEKNWKAV